MVEEGRRGDVPGQMRDRGGAAARRAEVPRILHQEGDQRSREGPSEVGVARPRVVRVWLDAAAPVVDLGDEVECMLPRQVVLECGHPQRRRRHVSRLAGKASGRLFPQNLTRTWVDRRALSCIQ